MSSVDSREHNPASTRDRLDGFEVMLLLNDNADRELVKRVPCLETRRRLHSAEYTESRTIKLTVSAEFTELGKRICRNAA